MSEPIKIDIWSDVACPWCYIGKRRLEAGLAAFAEEPGAPDLEIEYHSFELAPDTPVDFDGSAVDFLVEHKRLPESQVRQMHDQVAAIARGEGLVYDFEALQQTNTVKAHQLLHHAKAHGAQPAMKERLLRAHFVEGRHVGREEDLADLAAAVGIDRDEALRSLRADEYLPAVRADQRLAQDYGISGVPFYVIDGRYGISGAQPAETFTEALRQVAAERGEGRVA